MHNILAIDQSLTNSGIAISEQRDPTSVSISSIKPHKDKRGIERLMIIEATLLDLFNQYKISVVIMEDYAYGKVNGMAASGELGGIIKRACFLIDLPCITMPINSHKKFTTGKGNSKKNLMLKAVFQAYNIDLDDDNQADAVSILKTYQGYLQSTGIHDFGLKLTIKRTEALKALSKSLNN